MGPLHCQALFYFLKYLFIYLAALGFSCSLWVLFFFLVIKVVYQFSQSIPRCKIEDNYYHNLWVFLVVIYKLLAVACGM